MNKPEEFDSDLAQFYNMSKDDLEPEESSPISSRLLDLHQRYEINQLVDQGGMKRIYEAMDLQCNRIVALAKPQKDLPKELYENFLREAQLTASLEHPNITPIYDISIDPKHKPFFVMEFIKGDNLEFILNKLQTSSEYHLKKYPLDTLLNILVKVCDAVSYAHSKSVLHLDIKPSNIQIGQFGEVLLCDWGLAKLQGHEDHDSYDEILFNPDLLNSFTLSGKLKGTPGYMAPEQVNKKESFSKQTDIYSLGALLYTILSLHAPFKGTTEEILENTSHNKIIPLQNSSIPNSLKAIVYKAMETSPSNRYSSVESLQQDIQSFLSGYATKAEKAGFIKEGKLFYQRNKVFCLITSIALTLFASTLIGFIFIQSLQLQNQSLLKEVSVNKQESADYHFKTLSFFLDPVLSVDNAIIKYDAVLKQYPGNEDSIKGKRQALFISQQFSIINDNLEINSIDRVYQLSATYVDRINPKTNRLSPDDFLALIKETEKVINAKRFIQLSEKMVAYALAFPEYEELKGPLVERLLQAKNPGWDGRGFIYLPNKKQVTINSDQIEFLGDRRGNTGLSYLRFLNLENLRLSNQTITSLADLGGLSLHTLDLSHSKVTDIIGVRSIKALEQIILKQGQVKESEIRKHITDRINTKVTYIE